MSDFQVLNIKTKSAKRELARVDIPNTVNTYSGVIRHLDAAGLSRSEIVRYFKQHLDKEIRYQHVRNVLTTPAKRTK